MRRVDAARRTQYRRAAAGQRCHEPHKQGKEKQDVEQGHVDPPHFRDREIGQQTMTRTADTATAFTTHVDPKSKASSVMILNSIQQERPAQ